jgi:hypothetical protein
MYSSIAGLYNIDTSIVAGVEFLAAGVYAILVSARNKFSGVHFNLIHAISINVLLVIYYLLLKTGDIPNESNVTQKDKMTC